MKRIAKSGLFLKHDKGDGIGMHAAGHAILNNL